MKREKSVEFNKIKLKKRPNATKVFTTAGENEQNFTDLLFPTENESENKIIF